MTAYAGTYPNLCKMTEDDDQGGLRFEIDKHWISIRLTGTYSQNRINAASYRAKENGIHSQNSNL